MIRALALSDLIAIHEKTSAKPSCAAKIAAAVDAGILGYMLETICEAAIKCQNDRRKNMDIETVKALWKPREGSRKAGMAWWNGRAEPFSAFELPTAGNSSGMRIIEHESMVTNSCTVFDVGCGCGRFSFALENMGTSVTATD